MKIRVLILLLILVSLLSGEIWLPCPKPLSGHIETSLGLHFWEDHLYIRNLQARALIYLYPGIRLNVVARGNKEINQIEFSRAYKPVYNQFQPGFDESYLELFGYYFYNDLQFSSSSRIGRIRFLQFPDNNIISRFDQVAGMSDIRSSYEPSAYNGAILINDLSWRNIGWHNTIYQNGYDHTDISLLNNYLYFIYDNDLMMLEARAGKLPVRDHSSDAVLMESAWGWCGLIGVKWQGYDLNLYYEKVDNVIYTGLSIRFASSPFTRFAGKVRLDYNRSCEGFVFQYPLFYQDINMAGHQPKGLTKVGEIRAERVISFWRIGMQRNFYENIISRKGITDPALTKVVIKTEPMLLGIESIVSPVYEFDKLSDINKWDSQGIRPGILTQQVIYEFYQ
ncbi:MAG: hypothetical protein P9X26_08160 [Candidatus Stygibacter frigidus]|nr:hypothetical protein [Candidatus Stygibacter frigidus]